MKGLKLILLVLALALPIGIFLFLKIFGKNEFSVEPYYITGVSVPDGCPLPAARAYAIPERILNRLSWSEKDSLTLFLIALKEDGKANLERIQDRFLDHELRKVWVQIDSNSLDFDPIGKAVFISLDSLKIFKTCFFFLKEPYNLLLVDNKRRIRGMYVLNNREEIDRLLLEAKIILKKY
ncbi:MAG: hypothetical protein KF725_05310 [Cyclobacteriaceae bacterium]|nr:hypothetical protein [Cyclobacteriaceae bacterium]UYN85892.1 MAG: hypothetical protein KIT51_13590 [Cyclobacteriaceae bacterium]